ncbi:MAG: hypothetical protein RML72_03125 [Bacteroidia bacterium]|nr:hypothetical protein [Bacteroidia bacterium]MDW8157854.1 hypothetical protein [Bacteroidia bacterium]
MKIQITTKVNNTIGNVYKGFDKYLFMQLSPPFPIITVRRFDGCNKGDAVHLDISFGIFKERWISIITDNVQTEDKIYFIDEGMMLPFFLKYWRHTHILEKIEENKTAIIDVIEYRAINALVEILVYPFLYLQFLYRKPIYQKIFNRH